MADTNKSQRKELERYIHKCENLINKSKSDYKYLNALVEAGIVAMNEFGDKEWAFEIFMNAKNLIAQKVKAITGKDIFLFAAECHERELQVPEIELFWEILLLESRDKFDSYLLYLEKNRQYKDMFYLPRRKCLRRLGIIQALQDLEDDKLDILSISLPPGTGKTTLEKFFATWVIGRNPDDYSLFFSHSDDITRMFYDGILDITTNDIEYTWATIFPTMELENTNAKRQTINFNYPKAFASIQCTSVGAKNAGKVRCNKYLYCDDLIGGIEEAMNKTQLDKLWRIYGTDAKQRKTVTAKNKAAKELHIATRWSVHDPIGRLQLIYQGNPRARFLAFPDIDPVTEQSNFMYDLGGMSVKFFKEIEKTMDDIAYRCLYKNDPIEREGMLYHEDELRTYETLPDREPDAIMGVCDCKNKGTDFMVLPCVYVYGEDHYLVDVVCDDTSDYDAQYRKLSALIVENEMQQVEFESNAGGDRIAVEVANLVKTYGGRCNITTKPTESNKETRIIVNADWIKKHMLFKSKNQYSPKSDYGRFMTWLLTYSVVGKNVHDDVPDALANYALFVTKEKRVSRVEAVYNPFISRRYF